MPLKITGCLSTLSSIVTEAESLSATYLKDSAIKCSSFVSYSLGEKRRVENVFERLSKRADNEYIETNAYDGRLTNIRREMSARGRKKNVSVAQRGT